MGAVRSAGEFSRTRRTRLNWHGLHSLRWPCHLGPRRKVNSSSDTDSDTNSDTHTNANSYRYSDANTNSDACGW